MSKQIERQKSLEITGSHEASASPTGTQLGVTGSGKQLCSLPRPHNSMAIKDDPRHELPIPLQGIVSAEQAHLISYLRFGREPADPELKPAAQHALAEVEQMLEPYCLPAEPHQILTLLTAVADALSVELPTDEGLALYIDVLSDTSYLLLKQATGHVLRTHAYKTMPVPHDFIRPIGRDRSIYRFFYKKVQQWQNNHPLLLA